MERVLAAMAAVVLLLDALVLISADPAPPSIAIDGPISPRTALPSPSPTVVTPSTTPSEDTSVTEVPTETPTRTSPATPTPGEVPTTPAPSPAPVEYGPAVFTTTVAVDGAHYYDGEAVHVTVEVCNPEDHHVRRQYHRHEPLSVTVIDYWHDAVASVVPIEAQADHPVRKETWAPRECRTYEYDWGLWASPPDRGRAREGVFRIHAEANGSNDPNDGGTTATDGYSSWFEHHHGSRPVEEPPPPPSDHSEEPGFSLSVTTDSSSYTDGQTVRTTVTACNETDREQHHEVTADPPLTVVYMRPDEHEEVAYQGQYYDENHDEPDTIYTVFEITFAPRECRSYRYAWDQTRNSGPEGDPRMGQREPGTYSVEAIWQADWTGRPEGHHASMYGTSPRFELR